MGIAYIVPAFADAHQASKLRLTIGPRGHQIESIEYNFWRLAAKALQEVEGDLTAFVERHNFAVDDGIAGKFQSAFATPRELPGGNPSGCLVR